MSSKLKRRVKTRQAAQRRYDALCHALFHTEEPMSTRELTDALEHYSVLTILRDLKALEERGLVVGAYGDKLGLSWRLA